MISQSEKTYVDTHTNQCHTIKSNSSLEKQCNALTSHLSPLTFSLSLSLSHLSPLTSHSHCHSPSHSWASQACHPSRFRVSLALFGQKTSKQTGMTSLGGLSSQSVSRFCDPFRPESPQTDWDDKPGFPRLVIPVRFGFLLAIFGEKTLKRTGMTSLGFPGLSSQSVSGFFASPFRLENPETDWDDKPGLPRLVSPIRFGFFYTFSARKP